LRQVRSLDAFPGFRFGRHDRNVSPQYRSLPYDERTDADGHAELAVELPEMAEATAPLRATIAVRVAEGSGRPVERKLERDIAPEGPVIGIKPMFEDVLPMDSTAGF